MLGLKIWRTFRALLVAIFAISINFSTTYVLPGTVPSADQTRLTAMLANVYETMDDHYYLPVSPALYEKFLLDYPAARLMALNEKSRKTPDVVHLGAGLLVNTLKNSADKYTNFVPPEKEKEFKENAYAVTEDLGIEGTKNAAGFLITIVRKHS